ncbi:DUF3106 domain-containing protein [Luteimonas sp. 3794]|uniref:DUF3106 domain-containing protein n=1 Tax=Luteimonas sp. 3794 TaxID=2817730 RepID=UPI0028541CA2|nr:DUF3106 domain-containing protein [Luteimonas sp. 3794]MDR6991893.1 hypothetical protein [Luteimonas sp. 3794]
MRISERLRRRGGVALLLLAAPLAQAALPAGLQAQSLPAAERARLEARVARLAQMTPAEHATLQARLAAWQALPAGERARRRIAYQAVEALPHAERMQLQRAAAHFDTLPEPEQRALRLAFEQLDQSLRRGWLLGPVLGADWPRLHPLFSAMPEDQRGPALLALRATSAQARDDLAALAQRTPPHERDALRAEWLAVPADTRDAWLRARVSGTR